MKSVLSSCVRNVKMKQRRRCCNDYFQAQDCLWKQDAQQYGYTYSNYKGTSLKTRIKYCLSVIAYKESVLKMYVVSLKLNIKKTQTQKTGVWAF